MKLNIRRVLKLFQVIQNFKELKKVPEKIVSSCITLYF